MVKEKKRKEKEFINGVLTFDNMSEDVVFKIKVAQNHGLFSSTDNFLIDKPIYKLFPNKTLFVFS